MTHAEKEELIVAMERSADLIERARTLIEEMTDGYFGKHSINSNDGRSLIVWDFPRQKVFAALLEDVIRGMEAELPKVDWVQSLSAEEAVEGKA